METIKTELWSRLNTWETKKVTRADGTVATTLDNGQINTDLRNRTPQPVAPAPQIGQGTEAENIAAEPWLNNAVNAPQVPQVQPVVQPVQEPIVQTPVAPVPQPVTPTTPEQPVQTVEEKRTAEINLENQENALVQSQEQNLEVRKQKATQGFQSLIEWKATTQQLSDYVKRNSAFKDDFTLIAKNALKTRSNNDFIAKYSAVSNETLYTSIKKGEVVVWSDKYNLLSPEQRQSFENYKKIEEKQNTIPETKDDLIDFNSPQYSVDFWGVETLISKMFSSDLKEKLTDLRNDDRVVKLETELNAKALEIELFDIKSIKESEKLRDELNNSWFTPAFANATVRDNETDRTIERLALLAEHSAIQGNLSSVKDDLDFDLELFRIEDAQNKEKYSTLLWLYESRRAEGITAGFRAEDRANALSDIASEREFQTGQVSDARAFQVSQTEEERTYQRERDEFIQKNNELATERQQNFQKEVLGFEQDFAKEILWLNQDFDLKKLKSTQQFQKEIQKWDYIDDGNGNLVYVKDWKQINVLSGLGQNIGSWTEWDWAFQNFKNDDGTITTVKTSKNTWEVQVVNKNIDWQTPWGYLGGLWDGIKANRHYGGAYDKFQWLDIDGQVWDPIYAPFSWEVVSAQSERGYGISVVIKDDVTWEKIRYSHLDPSFLVDNWTRFEQGAQIGALWNTGNVLKLNWQKPTAKELAAWFWSHIDIVSYDANGRARSSRETEKYLENIGGTSTTETVLFDEKNVPLYAKYNSGKLTSAEYKTIWDLESFKEQATNFGKESAKPWYDRIQSMIDLAESLKWLNPAQRQFPDNQVDVNKILGRAGMQELIELKSQWATFGSLTEREFDRIQSSVLNVWSFTSAEKWTSILTEYQDSLRAWLPQDYTAPIVEPTDDGLYTPTTSWFQYTPSASIDTEVNSFFN